ncbi:MAG: PepSY-like domain-containing protein [Labilithrix sp.]|nr:PepSY-like domain-containing protein [Labilithrix sp.]MBX3224835.1 PepSY-like domain-containing protein [Labilithrix sp.]
MKKSILTVILALAASTAFALPAAAGEKLTLEQVPAKVKETIQKHVKDGKITEIEREKEGTATVYEVEYKSAKGTEHELKIGEDGKLLPAKKD